MVDEYGALQGLVTLEDILAEIFGEFPTNIRPQERPDVRRRPDGSYLVDGTVPVRDLNRELDWNLPDEGATTIAGLVIHEARHHSGTRPALRLLRLQVRNPAPPAQPDHGAARDAAGQERNRRRARSSTLFARFLVLRSAAAHGGAADQGQSMPHAADQELTRAAIRITSAGGARCHHFRRRQSAGATDREGLRRTLRIIFPRGGKAVLPGELVIFSGIASSALASFRRTGIFPGERRDPPSRKIHRRSRRKLDVQQNRLTLTR